MRVPLPLVDFADMRVRCVCGSSRSLKDALVERANPLCSGKRPWLGPEGQEPCNEHPRLLVRTATNAYFAHRESALSIPEPKRELEERVQGILELIRHASTEDDLPPLRRIPKVAEALKGYSDAGWSHPPALATPGSGRGAGAQRSRDAFMMPSIGRPSSNTSATCCTWPAPGRATACG